MMRTATSPLLRGGHHPGGRQRRGFLLVSVMLITSVLFMLVFALMTLSQQRTRLVRSASDRVLLSAEARSGLAEAAHYLSRISDWSGVSASTLPTGAATLNPASGVARRLEILSVAANEVRIRSLGYFDRPGGAEGPVARLEATFRRPGITFPGAAGFGASGARLDSWARTDSYNSTLGSYAQTQGDEGHIGSNLGSGVPVTLAANAQVSGELNVLQGTTPDISDSASHLGIQSAPDAQPLPSMTPPAALSGAASAGDVLAKGSRRLSPGRYGDIQVAVKGELILEGGTYLVDSLELLSQAEITLADGPVVLYFRESLRFCSNSEVNTRDPSQDSTRLQLFFDATSPEAAPRVDLESNVTFVGMIYSPEGPVDLASNVELFGGVVGDTVRLRSNAQVHYDQRLRTVSLSTAPSTTGCELSSWQSW